MRRWDPAYQAVLDEVAAVARSRIRVVFTGPPGVGKTHLVRELHRLSRRHGALKVVDCPATQPTLFESTLFGHVRGAFTGADRTQPGLVKAAKGGTLFFEEVGDLSSENQSRLLSFLGSERYTPVGGHEEHEAEVRVVAATHQDLEARLKPELLHRLAEVVIAIPRLQDRPDDIVPLAEDFVQHWAREEGWRPLPISREARVALLRRSWPENVRGLSTAVHLALNTAHREGSRELLARHFSSVPIPRTGTLRRRMAAIEREMLTDALRACSWNVTETARRLGVRRPWVHSRMRQLGIRRER